MTCALLVPSLPVLTEEDVWPEFAVGLCTLGETWGASSGRCYRLELKGRRLTVSLMLTPDALEPPIPAAEIDRDLFELACAVQEAVGGDWSADGLRRSAAIFGWRSEG